MAISAEACVAALGDLLANKPADTYTPEALDWFGDVAGTVAAFNVAKAVPLHALLGQITEVAATHVFSGDSRHNAVMRFYTQARAIYRELQLETNAYQTAQFDPGQVHDYFEEVRRIIGAATTEVFFVDAYIDAEFVSRYLPQVPANVRVRLLTSQSRIATLSPAVHIFRQQSGMQVELRSKPDRSIHDRHLIIDGREVYHSGASFKDGARNAPTSITQIVDAAAQMIAAYEVTWSGASPVA